MLSSSSFTCQMSLSIPYPFAFTTQPTSISVPAIQLSAIPSFSHELTTRFHLARHPHCEHTPHRPLRLPLPRIRRLLRLGRASHLSLRTTHHPPRRPLYRLQPLLREHHPQHRDPHPLHLPLRLLRRLPQPPNPRIHPAGIRLRQQGEFDRRYQV
jgi:hypothetical protein